ncbi:MAG: SurA N-terminal domain-containing protein [Bacteroidales bacterium]|jgi:peptidyl-prolyl cis-trans isomerase D|nr:SurA N-terminal domain-containing protein [Bacteroidales bacterium]
MAIIGRIRKRAGWAVAIIAIAILSFIFSDIFTRNGNSRPNDIATIDGIEITENEFYQMSQTIETNMKQQYQTDNLTPEQTYQVHQQAYQELLSEKLLLNQYEAIGLRVGKEELNDMFFGDFIHPLVLQNFSDPTTGNYNKQAVSQYIAQFEQLPVEEQASWRNFEQYVKRTRLQEKYTKLLSKGMYMPKQLAKHLSEVYSQKTSSRYVTLPFSSIADNNVKIEEKDYKEYYQKHKNEFKLNEELRDVEFVKFPITPSPEDIKQINDTVFKTFEVFKTTEKADIPSFVSTMSDRRFDSNYYKKEAFAQIIPDSILSKVKVGEFIPPFQNKDVWVMAKLTSIEQRPDSIRFSRILILNNQAGDPIKRSKEEATQIKDSLMKVFAASNAEFENNVANFSDDPDAKKNMGDAGWLLDGQLPSDLYNQINSTPVGGIFVYNYPSEMGYMIVKVTGKTTPVTKLQLATIITEIRPSEKTINEIRDKANVFLGAATNMSEFTNASQKQNLNVLTSQVRDMDYQLNGTPYAREVVRWIYNKDTKVGDVAPEIFEFSDMILVVGLKDIKKKGILSLEQTKPYIENMVRIEKKATTLMKKATDLVAANKTLDNIATKENITIDSAANISFGDSYFVKAGPEMNVLGKLSCVKTKGIQNPIKGYNGIYIVEVDDISKSATPEDPQAIQRTFDMRNSQKTAQLRFPLQVLQQNANIENHFSFFF